MRKERMSWLELTTYGLQVFGLVVFLSLTQVPSFEGLTPFDFDQLVGCYLVYFGVLGIISFFLDAPMFFSFGGALPADISLGCLRKVACVISVGLVLIGVSWIIQVGLPK